MKTSQIQIDPHQSYGNLIHAWRNEIKHTLVIVAQETAIPLERLKELEKGCVKPEWHELEKLAKQFCISVRDLLPSDYDLDRKMKFHRFANSKKIEQKRNGQLQYTYYSRVMTPVLPNIKPIELVLHLTQRESVVMNRGHFFHQYTEVLHGGPVAYLWEESGVIHEEVFEERDSWLIPGFVPHAFYSPNADRIGRILAITFGQHLTGDARQELALMGKGNIPRIVEDREDYYVKDDRV